MGALANQKSTTVIAAVIAAVITGLNIFLLYQVFM
jgi:Mn2+/Fe2+ NRAMP family transporter